MTAFSARLALDCRRVQGGYTDLAPCIKLSPDQLHSSFPSEPSTRDAFAAPGTESMPSQIEFSTQSPRLTASLDQPPERAPPESTIEPNGDADILNADADGASQQETEAGDAAGVGQSKAEHKRKAYGVSPALHWYMERVHAPLLAQPLVKLIVLVAFVGLGTLSLAAVPHVSRYAPMQQGQLLLKCMTLCLGLSLPDPTGKWSVDHGSCSFGNTG